MNDAALWHNQYYMKTAISLVLFFFIVGTGSYLMQLKYPKWKGVWASLKSWVITAPLVFFFAALPSPWPLVFIGIVAIGGAKTFFRMTGMYHRSWYVLTTYVFIIAQGYLIYKGHDRFFNIMPMIFLGVAALIPIFQNSYKHVIQYLSLSLINFIIMGWGFMHLGRIVLWPGGPLIALYLVILFEFCESTNYAISSNIGHFRPIANITSRFTLEGFIGSTLLTVLLAWGARNMLPHRTELYWLAASFSVTIVGRIGGLTLSAIRRDLNVKDSSLFIIGRDDILSRIDKPMFAAPFFYFAYLIIEGVIKI